MATVQYWIKTNYKGVLLTLAVTIVGFSLAYVLDFSSVLVTLVIGMMLAPWVSRPNVAAHVDSGLQFSLALPLQIGTGLLGLKITDDLLELMSPSIIILIILGVLLTLGLSVLEIGRAHV